MNNDQTPYFALELIEAIVEQLADSPHALRACALVCNAWLPVAFRILFHRFTLRAGTKLLNPSSLRAGLMFPHYVSYLIVMNGPNREIPRTTLKDALSLFDRASRICMLHCEFKPHQESVLHQTHPHLREFEITSISFASAYSLQAFVAAFTHLEHLSMSYYSRSETRMRREPANHLLQPPPLSSLEYKSSDVHRTPFLHWLSDHQPMIKHLTLLHLSPSEHEPAAILFRALGPHLRSLDVSYSRDARGNQPQAPICLPLQTNTCLHTLRIFYIPLVSDDLIPRPCIPPTLFNTTSPTLRCIALQFDPGRGASSGHNDALEWHDLDAMLARQAPALECLHMHVLNKRLYEHTMFMRTVLEAQMPWCLQRGALRGMDVTIEYGQFGFPLHETLPSICST
ncbi:hypothetical protein BD779DRAFT_1666892 [Infundibulicybe gibba]|nr:hypothetical protein BD779DRAFT_1666892 [Infundibulicybe gibba]